MSSKYFWQRTKAECEQEQRKWLSEYIANHGDDFHVRVIWQSTGSVMTEYKGRRGLRRFIDWKQSVDEYGVHDVSPTVDVRDYRLDYVKPFEPDLGTIREALYHYGYCG
jgi:hypothetical protein